MTTWPDDLLGLAGLEGVQLLHVGECASTQLECARLAREGAPHGTVVVADRQTAGRGRSGRSWMHVEGALAFSILLRPTLRFEHAPRLTFLTAAGLLTGLDALGVSARAKWPNDILVPHPSSGPLGPFRKIAGVLIELSGSARGIEHAVVGIGMNLRSPAGGFADELALIASSLEDAGGPVARGEVLSALLPALMDALADPADDAGFAHTLDVLRGRSATLGRHVRVPEEGLAGLAIDLDSDGALIVDDEGGARHRVVAGDVWPDDSGPH